MFKLHITFYGDLLVYLFPNNQPKRIFLQPACITKVQREFVFPKYAKTDCQAHHLTLWQVHVLAKPTILPCSMTMYGRSSYLVIPPSYHVVFPFTCKTPHLTLSYVPELAKALILPCAMSLYLPSHPSYLVACTFQTPHIYTLYFLRYSSINENMSYVDG